MNVNKMSAKFFTRTLVWCNVLLLFIGCEKKNEHLPVYGIITWNVGSSSFKADLFAVANKRASSINGSVAGLIYGVATKENALEIQLDPLLGPGFFTAGGNILTFNVVHLTYLGKDYFVDNNAHATLVTITLIVQSDKKIVGTIYGQISAPSGEIVQISGSFDMMIN